MEERISQVCEQFGYFDLNLHGQFESHDRFLKIISNLQFSNEEIRNKCVNELVENRIEMLKEEIEFEEKIGVDTRAENIKLEMDIINISEKMLSIHKQLNECKHRKFVTAMEKYGAKRGNGCHNVLMQDLIRTQIEFCLSDCNLRCCPKLLNEMRQSNKRGFLPLSVVKNLPCIKLLNQSEEEIVAALGRSRLVTTSGPSRGKGDRWVGRSGFEAPQETAIKNVMTFDRSVFVYGLPLDCDDKFVYRMLEPFGKVLKIVFDDGHDSIDRSIRNVDSQSPRKECDKYNQRSESSSDNNSDTKVSDNNKGSFCCRNCHKIKMYQHGHYWGSFLKNNGDANVLCLKCARLSIENSYMCENEMKGRHIRNETKNEKESKTCLAIFASEKQASQCVFQDYCCMRYLDYLKAKKEILLKIQAFSESISAFVDYTEASKSIY